jgi:hypothetical protein
MKKPILCIAILVMSASVHAESIGATLAQLEANAVRTNKPADINAFHNLRMDVLDVASEFAKAGATDRLFRGEEVKSASGEVSCQYTTPLAKSINEAAHIQIGLAGCNGLSPEDFKSLDFTKVYLKEFIEQVN